MRDFDKIKNYQEFKRYKWTRAELQEICKDHGLKFAGTEKELNRVIESYYNGVVIPPRRNWYTNKVLSTFVNENDVMICITFGMLFIAVLLCGIGIVNKVRATDDLYYVPHLVFGVVLLILAIIGIRTDRTLEVLKSYSPKCGDKRFTREQIDAQANSEQTEHLCGMGILLAPEMMIGYSAGVAAVAYEDVSYFRIKETWHSERIGGRYSNKYREYYTYKIAAITNEGKAVVLSNSTENPETELDKVYPYILKYKTQLQPPVYKKSLLASDDKPKQVTEGKGIRSNVEKAVSEQHLIPVSVSEKTKKKLIRYKLGSALLLIPISFAIAAGAIGLLFLLWRVLNIGRGTATLLIGVFFPVYAIYCFFKTLVAIKKGDMEFYSGEVVGMHKDGYAIRGLRYHLGYIEKMKPKPEPFIGDSVIIARLMNEFSLVADK